MVDKDRCMLGDELAEGRASAIAIHVLGYLPFIHLEWQKMVEIVEYIAAELKVVAECGYDDPRDCVSPDCREMQREDIAKVLPGLVSWEDLKASSDRVFKAIGDGIYSEVE